jgi:hypothetical protein
MHVSTCVFDKIVVSFNLLYAILIIRQFSERGEGGRGREVER